MQNQNLKNQISCKRRAHSAQILCALISCALVLLCGCSIVKQLIIPPNPPSDQQLLQSYHQTTLNKSGSGDVLATICMPEYELLSQSKSVIASVGQKKKGHKIWLKMVAFDENELTAKRKYFLIADETPKILWGEPMRNLAFDTQMALEAKLLNEPYANENARRIAVLKRISENVNGDIAEVALDNKMISVCGMMINQALNTVLVKLDTSPVLASKLSEPEGLNFDHITLGKSNITMAITDYIAKVKITAGSFEWKFDDPFALE